MPEVLAAEALTDIFLLVVLPMFQKFLLFQHKSIINWTSVSNITMPQLIRSWLEITSASVLDEYVDYTKVLSTVLLLNRELG